MTNIQSTIASLVPARVRAAIYFAVAVLTLVEGIWDFMPDDLQGKVFETIQGLTALLALSQVGDTKPPADPDHLEGAYRVDRGQAGLSTVISALVIVVLVLLIIRLT